MKFSVIVPSRNRAKLLEEAIDSVRAQQGVEMEVIVVHDGSGDDAQPAYRELAERLADVVRMVDLPQTPNGHGQSGSLNIGASVATGDYLCFLDDDDTWTDPQHLARVASVIADLGGEADAVFANQHAFIGERCLTEKLWLSSLDPATLRALKTEGTHEVTVEQLLGAEGFGHLNATVVSRRVFTAMKGFDENLRYECDRDFYYRLIDHAGRMGYVEAHVSRHNVPDPSKGANMSTVVTNFQKRNAQLYLLNKQLVSARHPAVRRHARTSLNDTLLRLSEELKGAGETRAAALYAREALASRFGLKRLVWALWLSVVAWGAPVVPRSAAR